MFISSRGVGRSEKIYKNKYWNWFFSIKLAKKLFPKLSDKKLITVITDFKLMSYDIVPSDDDSMYENMLGTEFGVHYLKEEIGDDANFVKFHKPIKNIDDELEYPFN